MSQPEESREKTAKTDATMDRRQAPPGPKTDGGPIAAGENALENTAALNEARRRSESRQPRR
jgi:hypothetical protein